MNLSGSRLLEHPCAFVESCPSGENVIEKEDRTVLDPRWTGNVKGIPDIF
jgi:hypothetical protein